MSTDDTGGRDRVEEAHEEPNPQRTDASREAARDPGGQRTIRGRESHEREGGILRGRDRPEESAHGQESCDRLAQVNSTVAHAAFAALAENVRDYAIFLLDVNGTITFWGEGARLMKWWTRTEAEGSHLRLLYPDGGSEDGTAEEHILEAAAEGEYTGEGHRMRSDLSTFWAGVTLTALRSEGGELLGFAKVTRDLTAQRSAESARQAALKSAEDASRAKSLFLATMSHEIRTPLNAIMAYTDIMEMELGGPLTAAQHDQLGKIRSSSQHLLGIVDEVLDFSRLESGRMNVGRNRLRIGGVVEQTLVLVEPQAEQRAVELVNSLSGYSAERRHGEGDPGRSAGCHLRAVRSGRHEPDETARRERARAFHQPPDGAPDGR